MALLSELYRMGYVYKSPKGKGNIKYIREDYNIYVTVHGYQRVAGAKVDHKWYTFKVPCTLKSFMTYKTNTVLKNVTENVLTSGDNNSFYDSSIDDKLGGRKEILGGGQW